jgi:hypothetical protein
MLLFPEQSHPAGYAKNTYVRGFDAVIHIKKRRVIKLE